MTTGFVFCPAFVNRAARKLGRAPARTSLLALVPAAGVLALASSAAPAFAAGPVPACTSGTCTVTFQAPGTGGSWTVPAGVSALSVTLYGGAGGSMSYGGLTAAGGDGAQVTATLTVTPGELFGVDVGGAGAAGDGQSGLVTAGGANGGGNGFDSGGGGGATDITAGGPLLVAGGGGGAGAAQPAYAGICAGAPDNATFAPAAGGAGGNADSPGTAGQSVSDIPYGGRDTMVGGGGGAPGTTSGPGAGGVAGPEETPGDFGVCPGDTVQDGYRGDSGLGPAGGSGLQDSYATFEPGIGDAGGGGGGGGYFGGGAGGFGASEYSATPSTAGSGGGGGGASYTAGAGVSGALVTDAGNFGQVNNGNGEAVLSYADPVATGSPSYNGTAGHTLNVAAASGLLSSAAGTTQESGLTASAASATTAQGGTVTVNADGSFGYTPASGFAGTDTFGYTVTDAAGDTAAGTAVVMVAASNPSPNADVAAGLSCTSSLNTGKAGSCMLVVTNHGPAAASALTAVVTLPAVVSEVSCTAGCAPHGNVLTWTAPSLAAGASVSYSVTIKAGSRPGTGLALGAAAAHNPDPLLLNNLALTIITVKH